MGVGRWDTCILKVVAHRRHREHSFWWKYLIEARDVILKMWSGLNWTVCLGRSDIGRCSSRARKLEKVRALSNFPNEARSSAANISPPEASIIEELCAQQRL